MNYTEKLLEVCDLHKVYTKDGVPNCISCPVWNYLHYSSLRLWIRTGNRHRSEQNAFGRFYTLYPACTFWLGGDVAGNNQNQIDGRLKRWN